MSQTGPAYTISIPGQLYDSRLTIPGSMPGLNDYIAAMNANRHKGNQMKQEHQEIVMWQIRAQMRKKRFTKPVFLLFTFYEKNRCRDHDNVSAFARKVIQDALVKSGMLRDDGWNHVSGYMDFFEVDKNNPRITVQFIEQEVPASCKKQPKKNSEK